MKEQSYFQNTFSCIKNVLHSIFPGTEPTILFRYSLVITAYAAFTILLTYPVAFTLGTNIPGAGDAFQWMNVLWYTNFALSHPEITSLAHTNMIFYPTGVPTTPFPSAFNQIITLFLFPFCQIQVIYSLLWLLSFILAAFGAYLLVRYLTQNNYAAFLSGIIFAFTPYHFVHGLGHLGATTIQWIPFCALFFMKVFREGGIKNCILAGIFYILVAMSDMQYMVFMGIFIAVLFLYENYIKIQANRGFEFEVHTSILIKYLIIGVVAFSVIVPLTLTDILVASSGNNFLKPNPLEAVTYSTDLLSFFLPSVLHPVFGGVVAPVYHNFTGNASEHTTYIGYSVLFLSILALFMFRRDLTVRFWGIIALFFSLLSMGPVLHVAGRTVFTAFNISIPLPHLILYYLIPFLENSRTTGRFFIVAALAFSVLAGYGCSELLKRYDTKKIIIVLLLGGFIIFEYLSIPFPMSPVEQPAFYQKIGQDPEQYALLEIPITANYSAGTKIIYFQTIHGKPVVGGQAARAPEDARDFEKNTPIIREITYFSSQQPHQDILIQNNSVTGLSVLRYYNIRYIILHKNYLSTDDTNYIQAILPLSMNQSTPVYNDKSIIAYNVPSGDVKPFMSLSKGWYGIENWYGTPARWMNDNATLLIYGSDEQLVSLHFDIRSFHIPRSLEIYSGNQSVSKISIPTNAIPVNVTIPIHKGENIISFQVPEGAERPSDLADLKNSDRRNLSMAVQNIEISFPDKDKTR